MGGGNGHNHHSCRRFFRSWLLETDRKGRTFIILCFSFRSSIFFMIYLAYFMVSFSPRKQWLARTKRRALVAALEKIKDGSI